MRHGKKFNHLGRTAPHRKAMLSNMSASLFLHKRISTTLAKAKELKKHVEPLITRAKEDTTHNRRIAFSFLQSKEAIKMLFGEVAEKVGNRPGGYTRIIKTGFRLGDNAEMCIIELVDFNELMLKDSKPAKKTTRRSRRGSGKASSEATSEKDSKAKSTEDSTAKAKADKKDEAKKEDPKKDDAKQDEVTAEKESDTEDDTTKKTDADSTPKSETTEPAPKAEDKGSDKKESGEDDKKAE